MADTLADTSARIQGESIGDRTARLQANKASSGNVDAMTKAEVGTTAGKGLGAKEKVGEDEPKQESGESLSAFGARMRKYRESQSSPQRRAIGKMLGSGS